jgi:hypothetical protein
MLDRAKSGDIRLTAEGWYNLTLAATGDKAAAGRAACAAMERANKESEERGG